MHTDSVKPILLAATLVVAACSSSSSGTSSGAGQVQVNYSGETLGAVGLPYPTSCPNGDNAPPFFVDGWSVFIDEYLVAVGNIRLTPGAQQYALESTLNSPPVAVKAGPYVFDGHKGGGLTSTDGVSPAGPIFAWNQQDDGQAFDATQYYAFSYDVVPATAAATQVNLSSSQGPDYDLMVQKGWSKYVRGHAVFAGITGPNTYPPDAGIAAQFNALPSTIYFSFGWDDSGGVLNCNNPQLGFTGEDSPTTRGIKPSPTAPVIAQITLHVDHVFWDTLRLEGTPLRFDQVAAWATGSNSDPTEPLQIQDLGVLANTLAATFADGTPLPDRAPYQTPTSSCYVSNQSNPLQVTLALNGVPGSVVSNLADFMAFSAQAQMHMNADGLCYEVGQHASDPWYSPGLPTP
jgi:hypothetical protein